MVEEPEPPSTGIVLKEPSQTRRRRRRKRSRSAEKEEEGNESTLPRSPTRAPAKTEELPGRKNRLRLRSAEPRQQKVNKFHQSLKFALKEGSDKKKEWKSLRCHQRVAWRSEWTKKLPKGSVGSSSNIELPADCSSCEEKTIASRPFVREFARRRAQGLPGLPENQRKSKIASLAVYQPPAAEESEEEDPEEDDPVIDRDPGSDVDYGGGTDRDVPSVVVVAAA